MTLTFDPIAGEQSLLKQKDYRAILAACPQITSDYSFLNLWGWAEVYGLEWAWEKGLVWIRQTLPEEKYWAPMGPWREVNWEMTRKAHISDGTRFIRVPETLCDIWREQNLPVSVEDARGQWDYLYSVHELTELKGNRYHKKKNLLNQFLKKMTTPMFLSARPWSPRRLPFKRTGASGGIVNHSTRWRRRTK